MAGAASPDVVVGMLRAGSGRSRMIDTSPAATRTEPATNPAPPAITSRRLEDARKTKLSAIPLTPASRVRNAKASSALPDDVARSMARMVVTSDVLWGLTQFYHPWLLTFTRKPTFFHGPSVRVGGVQTLG